MPVLSPHRSSASGLSGSYRPSYSSAFDRSYFNTPSYNPRITSYSERYTTRSYTDSDGRRVYTRSASITEDGVTTRYREESREGSARRDSISRDSGISSIRENSVLDYPRRDSSLSRNDRLSTINVADSVAELRNKYSPANYVPAILRKNENISRSKSINDIGLPPIEKTNIAKKKVNEGVFNSNNSNSVSNISNTNPTKNTDLFDETIEDDNGNRASVADLCKKFDEKPLKTGKICNGAVNGAKITENKFKKTDEPNKTLTNIKTKHTNTGVKKLTKSCNGDSSNGVSVNKNKSDSDNVIEKNPKKCQNNVILQSKFDVNDEKDDTKSEEKTDILSKESSPSSVNLTSSSSRSNSSSRVNNFASYIPTKDYQKKLAQDESDDNRGESKIPTTNGIHENNLKTEDYMENSKENILGKITISNDITASPKVARSALSPSNSTANSINSSSLSRRSSDKDREINYRSINNYIDDDSSGERSYGNIRSLAHSPVKTFGLNGLKNIGNTCFMNSVIQCLSNTKVLLEYLRKDTYIRDINTTTSSMKGALIRAFAEVIKELWSEDSSDRVVNTVSLKSQIQRFASRFMGYAQQDAQEFLRYLLEGLHEDVNRVTEKPKPIITEIDEKLSDSEKATESWMRYLRMDNSKIVDCFVGQLKSTLKCTYCGHCSVTFDPFWDLSLPMPQRTGQLRLSQCLDSFTREETLDGDEKPTCSKCKERRKCTKSFTIQKFPKILVIHLKRFSPTERFRGKLNVTVDFPLEGLEMSNYAADNVSPCRYNLYAVSNHSGTTYSGHYTAYCRHPYTGTWHEYNDSRVSSVSSKSIVSGEAYVLFYEQEGTKSRL